MSRIQSIPRLFVHYRPLMLKVFAAYNVHTIPYNVSGTKTFEDVCIRGIRQILLMWPKEWLRHLLNRRALWEKKR